MNRMVNRDATRAPLRFDLVPRRAVHSKQVQERRRTQQPTFPNTPPAARLRHVEEARVKIGELVQQLARHGQQLRSPMLHTLGMIEQMSNDSEGVGAMPRQSSVARGGIPGFTRILQEWSCRNRACSGRIPTNLDKSEHLIARSSVQDRRTPQYQPNSHRKQFTHLP